MRARLYIDEDAMDDDLVQALRLRGADVQTALEAGLVGRPDEEHLASEGSGPHPCLVRVSLYPEALLVKGHRFVGSIHC